MKEVGRAQAPPVRLKAAGQSDQGLLSRQVYHFGERRLALLGGWNRNGFSRSGILKRHPKAGLKFIHRVELISPWLCHKTNEANYGQEDFMSVTAVHNRLSDTVLKAVIIYDDFDSATRATALLERVALRADESMKWDIKPWRFDVLKQPALAALTAAVAVNADLVVLALTHASTMPSELLDWLRNWAEHRHVEDAALLMLPPDENEKPVSWDEARWLAERHNLIFLDRHNGGDNENSAFWGRRWHAQLVTPGPAQTFAGRPQRPPRWGINE